MKSISPIFIRRSILNEGLVLSIKLEKKQRGFGGLGFGVVFIL